jgi:hypothetical protein
MRGVNFGVHPMVLLRGAKCVHDLQFALRLR